MPCYSHVFRSSSFDIRLYHPSLPAGLPGCILWCPYKAVVDKF